MELGRREKGERLTVHSRGYGGYGDEKKRNSDSTYEKEVRSKKNEQQRSVRSERNGKDRSFNTERDKQKLSFDGKMEGKERNFSSGNNQMSFGDEREKQEGNISSKRDEREMDIVKLDNSAVSVGESEGSRGEEDMELVTASSSENEEEEEEESGKVKPGEKEEIETETEIGSRVYAGKTCTKISRVVYLSVSPALEYESVSEAGSPARGEYEAVSDAENPSLTFPGSIPAHLGSTPTCPGSILVCPGSIWVNSGSVPPGGESGSQILDLDAGSELESAEAQKQSMMMFLSSPPTLPLSPPPPPPPPPPSLPPSPPPPPPPPPPSEISASIPSADEGGMTLDLITPAPAESKSEEFRKKEGNFGDIFPNSPLPSPSHVPPSSPLPPPPHSPPPPLHTSPSHTPLHVNTATPSLILPPPSSPPSSPPTSSPPSSPPSSSLPSSSFSFASPESSTAAQNPFISMLKISKIESLSGSPEGTNLFSADSDLECGSCDSHVTSHQHHVTSPLRHVTIHLQRVTNPLRHVTIADEIGDGSPNNAALSSNLPRDCRVEDIHQEVQKMEEEEEREEEEEEDRACGGDSISLLSSVHAENEVEEEEEEEKEEEEEERERSKIKDEEEEEEKEERQNGDEEEDKMEDEEKEAEREGWQLLEEEPLRRNKRKSKPPKRFVLSSHDSTQQLPYQPSSQITPPPHLPVSAISHSPPSCPPPQSLWSSSESVSRALDMTLYSALSPALASLLSPSSHSRLFPNLSTSSHPPLPSSDSSPSHPPPPSSQSPPPSSLRCSPLSFSAYTGGSVAVLSSRLASRSPNLSRVIDATLINSLPRWATQSRGGVAGAGSLEMEQSHIKTRSLSLTSLPSYPSTLLPYPLLFPSPYIDTREREPAGEERKMADTSLTANNNTKERETVREEVNMADTSLTSDALNQGLFPAAPHLPPLGVPPRGSNIPLEIQSSALTTSGVATLMGAKFPGAPQTQGGLEDEILTRSPSMKETGQRSETPGNDSMGDSEYDCMEVPRNGNVDSEKIDMAQNERIKALSSANTAAANQTQETVILSPKLKHQKNAPSFPPTTTARAAIYRKNPSQPTSASVTAVCGGRDAPGVSSPTRSLGAKKKKGGAQQAGSLAAAVSSRKKTSASIKLPSSASSVSSHCSSSSSIPPPSVSKMSISTQIESFCRELEQKKKLLEKVIGSKGQLNRTLTSQNPSASSKRQLTSLDTKQRREREGGVGRGGGGAEAGRGVRRGGKGVEREGRGRGARGGSGRKGQVVNPHPSSSRSRELPVKARSKTAAMTSGKDKMHLASAATSRVAPSNNSGPVIVILPETQKTSSKSVPISSKATPLLHKTVPTSSSSSSSSSPLFPPVTSQLLVAIGGSTDLPTISLHPPNITSPPPLSSSSSPSSSPSYSQPQLKSRAEKRKGSLLLSPPPKKISGGPKISALPPTKSNSASAADKRPPNKHRKTVQPISRTHPLNCKLTVGEDSISPHPDPTPRAASSGNKGQSSSIPAFLYMNTILRDLGISATWEAVQKAHPPPPPPPLLPPPPRSEGGSEGQGERVELSCCLPSGACSFECNVQWCSSIGGQFPLACSNYPSPGVISMSVLSEFEKGNSSSVKQVITAETSSTHTRYKLYTSPLLSFRSYRLSPYYRTHAKLPLSSLSYSNKINPAKIMCKYDLLGKCNNPECSKQHFKDIALSQTELVCDIVAYSPVTDVEQDEGTGNSGLSGASETGLSGSEGTFLPLAEGLIKAYSGRISDEQLLTLAAHRVSENREKIEGAGRGGGGGGGGGGVVSAGEDYIQNTGGGGGEEERSEVKR